MNEQQENLRKKENKVRRSLRRNGIKTLKYVRGKETDKRECRYILDTRNTEYAPGNKLWGFIDFLVKFRGFIMLSEQDFKNKEAEKRLVDKIRRQAIAQ